MRKTLVYVNISTHHKKRVPVSPFLIRVILNRFYQDTTDLIEINDISRQLEDELCHIKSSYHHEYLSCKYSIPVDELINEEKKIKESIIDIDNVEKELAEFEAIGNSRGKLKYLVNFTTNPETTEQMINNFLAQIPSKYSNYYRLLGPNRIKANGYLEADLRKEWIKVNSEVKIDDDMITKIYNTFEVGKKYGKASIKSTLRNIYQDYNYDKTAKASDLSDYFVLKSTRALEDKTWVNGFEILGRR